MKLEGKDWKRHRKITNAPFNTQTDAVVWSEALQQAQEMLAVWLNDGIQGTSSTARDVINLTLHVLTHALFGQESHSFKDELEIRFQNRIIGIRDALSFIVNNVISAIIIPHSFLSLPFLPKKFHLLGQAIRSFNTYGAEMIAKERLLISKQDLGTNNMISSLVRFSEKARLESNDGRQGLADNEILGNVFIYTFAGHETTANSLAYCILLLAAYPEYQEWLSEEINGMLDDGEGFDTPRYNEHFPKLKRCLAAMVGVSS